jgi:hypothetical protein
MNGTCKKVWMGMCKTSKTPLKNQNYELWVWSKKSYKLKT